MKVKSSYSVLLVTALALSVGYGALIRGYDQAGLALCTTVIASFFGFCRKAKEYKGESPFMISNKESVLLCVVLAWAGWAVWQNHTILAPALTIVGTSVGGYFGLSKQEDDD